MKFVYMNQERRGRSWSLRIPLGPWELRVLLDRYGLTLDIGPKLGTRL